MKILNLYACLGGNRLKWDDVAKEKGIEIEVTAVELDTELAKMYQERFPNDNVFVADAHQYLLNHYKEFDFFGQVLRVRAIQERDIGIVQIMKLKQNPFTLI